MTDPKRLITSLPQAFAVIEMLEQELKCQINRIKEGENKMKQLLDKYKHANDRLQKSPFRQLDEKIYKQDHMFVEFYETAQIIKDSLKMPAVDITE